MRIHKKAALTVQQRLEIQRSFKEDGVSKSALARRFHTTSQTITKWVLRDSAADKSSAPLEHFTVVTPSYIEAVLAYRLEFPHHGPIRIVEALKDKFPQMRVSTVGLILKNEKKTKQTKPKLPENKIYTGKFRAQMDFQQLPAIEGDKGFEYKFSIIHLSTRWKYSEIHSEATTQVASDFFQRAVDKMPPFLSFILTMGCSLL